MNIKTISFFGLTLLKLVLKKIFLRKNQEEFLRNEFKEDGIFSISEKDRKIYPEFSRCINCGFCEIDLPLNSTRFQHPEVFFNSRITNLIDIIYEEEKFPEIKNFRCPAGASYVELLNFIENNSKS